MTPLHWAEFGHDEVCEFLIEKGADVNCAIKQGMTPSTSLPSTDMKMPLRCSSTTMPRTPPKRTLVCSLSTGPQVRTWRCGRDSSREWWRGRRARPIGQDPLHWAAEYGHAAVCELLLKLAHPVNTPDASDKTALDLAVAFQHAACANYLRELEASSLRTSRTPSVKD